MKQFFSLLLAVALVCTASAQSSLSEGAALLFKNVKTKLTEAEKQSIYKQAGFIISKDKKQFIVDAESADYPFGAMVYPTDLNNDKKEEIFIVYGNTYTSGMTGSNVILFIKNAKGEYKPNLGFPSSTPFVIPSKTPGYPELILGGPGFEFPVWKWNGKEYVYSRKIKDAAMQKIKSVYIDEASKKYTEKM